MAANPIPYPDPVQGKTCPKCARLVYRDRNGYLRCGRWWYGLMHSCGWRSRQPSTP
jgi:hypothetical protein